MFRSRFRGSLTLLALTAFVVTACGESPTSSDLDVDVLLAKGGNKDRNGGGPSGDDGGHTPLIFAFGTPTGLGIFSDGRGPYENATSYGGVEPVSAHFNVSDDRNAYLWTYNTTRELTFNFPTEVLAEVARQGYSDFPIEESFTAPAHMLIAGDQGFTDVNWEPGTSHWYAVEIEFYPQGMDGTMFEVHYSSLKVTRTEGGWIASSNCNEYGGFGYVDLSQRRRKRNRSILRMGSVNGGDCLAGDFPYLPATFSFALKAAG
jgi:hypothetical protein